LSFTKKTGSGIITLETASQQKMTDNSNTILTHNLKLQEFQCDQCEKLFGRTEDLQHHINAIHKKIKRFFCESCDFSSYHSKCKIHSNNAIIYKCQPCDKVFGQKGHLTEHINAIHMKIKVRVFIV
jgi:uncharacterized C2H2 Zn-finger protein